MQPISYKQMIVPAYSVPLQCGQVKKRRIRQIKLLFCGKMCGNA